MIVSHPMLSVGRRRVGHSMVGAAISSFRIRNGLTQADFGGLLGVNHAAASCWERGECMPHPHMLGRLMNILSGEAQSDPIEVFLRTHAKHCTAVYRVERERAGHGRATAAEHRLAAHVYRHGYPIFSGGSR